MRGLTSYLSIIALSLTVAMTAMAGEAVDYASDGMALEGYKAPAKGTSKGLVLVIHDWDGRTD